MWSISNPDINLGRTLPQSRLEVTQIMLHLTPDLPRKMYSLLFAMLMNPKEEGEENSSPGSRSPFNAAVGGGHEREREGKVV